MEEEGQGDSLSPATMGWPITLWEAHSVGLVDGEAARLGLSTASVIPVTAAGLVAVIAGGLAVWAVVAAVAGVTTFESSIFVALVEARRTESGVSGCED
jgi:hypothetical protein